MNKGGLSLTDGLQTKLFYHGTRAELKPGDLIEPSNPPDVDERDRIATHVYLTPNLDEAIWEAEIAVGEGPRQSVHGRANRPDWSCFRHGGPEVCGPFVDVLLFPRAIAGHGRGHGSGLFIMALGLT